MQKIIMGRGYGKTTQLIFLSAKKKIPILTPYNKEYITDLAKKLGEDIPAPVLLDDLLHDGCYQGSVLVDNADILLEKLLIEKFGVFPVVSTITLE